MKVNDDADYNAKSFNKTIVDVFFLLAYDVIRAYTYANNIRYLSQVKTSDLSNKMFVATFIK